MILIIDNYDSFTFNLYQLIGEINPDIKVVRNDKLTIEDIRAMQPDHIIISPGPGNPKQAGICLEVIRQLAGEFPILGVCLGHQVIGTVYGASVKKGSRPMHGKVTEIHNHGTGVFAGLPEKYKVTRYHSLIVREDSIPEEYQVDAVSDDGAVMGISHKTLPLYGVQFHPEAVLTEYGHELLENFCKIAEEFHQEREEELAEEKTA